MKVFFDDQMFRSRAYGGGGRLFFELMLGLTRIPSCEVSVFAGAYRTPLPLEELARRCRSFYGVRCPPLGPVRKWVERATFRLGGWCLDRGDFDLYHPTQYQPLEFHRKIVQVHSVFDLIQELYPQYYPGARTGIERKRALDQAEAVVCISEATRQRTLEFYPESESKLKVVPLASSLQLPAEPGTAPTRPYFLFVGNRGGYKNFRVMVEACRIFPGFAKDFTLICYGGHEFTAEEQTMIADNGLQSCVEQRTGDDTLLANLYRDAVCFVYPSREEGFGIPLLEAMNCRCAVLASRIPVFEEVAGDAANYFDPDSPEELAARMREMVDDDARKQELIRAGTRRAPLFSWERCARQHFEIYTAALSG